MVGWQGPAPAVPPDSPAGRAPRTSAWVAVAAIALVALLAYTVILTNSYPSAPVHWEESVSFSERGLPSGASWSVTFGGNPQTAGPGESVITFFVFAQGDYGYTIGQVPGYTAAPDSGTMMCNATVALEGPVTIHIAFSEAR